MRKLIGPALFPAALLVAFVVAPCRNAHAQEASVSPFSVLHLDASARGAALGGSFGSAPGDDATSFFYNAASLNESMHGTLALTYLNHVGDLNAGFAVYAREVENVGVFAAGLRFLGWGSITGADEQGNETGSFGASDLVLSVGGATQYSPRVRLGASVHGIYSGIEEYSATALAADASALVSLLDGRTHAGVGIHNLGFVLSSFGSTDDRLPLDVRLTLSHRLRHLPLLVSVTGSNLQAAGDAPPDVDGFSAAMRHLAVGGEFQFSEAFNVRFGYNHRRHQDLKMNARLDFAGVGMGFGLKVSRFNLDYAYSSWSSLGGLHQLTVRTRV